MSSPVDYISARASSYASDPRLSVLIDQASLETGNVFQGDLRNKAIALLVLHWLTVDDRFAESPGAVGTLQMEKEGSLQRQYMMDFSVTRRDPDLSQTKWGLELRQLRKSCIFSPMTRMSEIHG